MAKFEKPDLPSGELKSRLSIQAIEVPGVGSGQPMLGLQINYPIDNNTCLAFNKMENVANNPGYSLPPLLGGLSGTPMYHGNTGNGDYDVFTNAGSNNGGVTPFSGIPSGHMQFCGANTDRAIYELGWEMIYAVLWVR